MGTVRHPDKVKLIIGLLFADIEKYHAVKKSLVKIFGRIDFESGLLDFKYTTYYNEETGPGIKRVFLSFERLLDMENIYTLKIKTNLIEKKYSRNGKRAINIDPGYLDLAKIVLFSTKDYTHRIYLARGIYAETALFYKDGGFNPWPWTYPDYKSMEYMNIFVSMRRIYKEALTGKG